MAGSNVAGSVGGGILVVTESTPSEMMSIGTMEGFRRPGRKPENERTEW